MSMYGRDSWGGPLEIADSATDDDSADRRLRNIMIVKLVPKHHHKPPPLDNYTASASIVFKDNKAYSQKLVHGAKTLFKFARDQRGRYSAGNEAATFYNSSSYFNEFVWGSTWLYYATGNNSYLQLATNPGIYRHAGAFWGGPYYGVLSWENKLAGAQVLLSRLRLFLSPGYPYEEILRSSHNQTSIFMCSFLPFYTSFNRTRGGMIQLNHGNLLLVLEGDPSKDI